MLISMKYTMNKARQEGYCVPAFGIGNEHNLRACLSAAEEKKSPVIMLVMSMNNPDIEYFGRIATDLAIRSSVPVSIILDHGATFEEEIHAIRAGFSDVMIDASKLPYAENWSIGIERTFAPDSYWRGKGVTLSQIARDPDRFDRDHTQSTQKTGQARRYNGRRPAQQGGTPIVNPASVLEVVA